VNGSVAHLRTSSLAFLFFKLMLRIFTSWTQFSLLIYWMSSCGYTPFLSAEAVLLRLRLFVTVFW